MKVTPKNVRVVNPWALWARFDPRYEESFSAEEIFPDFLRTLWSRVLKKEVS